MKKEKEGFFSSKRKTYVSDYKEFREFSLRDQIIFSCMVTTFLLIYSGAALLLEGKWYYFRESAHTVYLSIFLITILMMSVCLLSLSPHFIKNVSTKAGFFELFVFIGVVIYLSCSFAIVVYTYDEGSQLNYMPAVIVFAATILFLYHNPIYYFIYFFICCGACYWLVIIIKKGDYSKVEVADVVLFGVILLIGGLSKYYVGLKAFRARCAENSLRLRLEKNNDDLKNANKILRELSDTLEARNESQKRFTASLSHELRSPLNGVIGLLQVVLDDDTLTEEQRLGIEKAFYSSSTLIQIVNDLLDYSKLEAGEFNIIKAPFDLREVIRNISGGLTENAENKGLYLDFDISPDTPCMLKGDGIRIQQILTNIISNAIKYTTAGGAKVKIRYEENNLLMTVSDTGQGIPESMMNDIYTPYKRFDEEKNRFVQGTGLGLSIVKLLVDQMDGDISIESEVGKGTTVYIKLPLEIVDERTVFSDPLSEHDAASKIPDLKGTKILCIDDNKVNLTVFKGLMKPTGGDVTLLDNGPAAIEDSLKNKYDIIFIDHMMPDMDGIQTFEQLRSEGLNIDTPKIMLTANAGLEAEQLYKSIGFSGYLSKPILRDSLYEIITKTLHK